MQVYLGTGEERALLPSGLKVAPRELVEGTVGANREKPQGMVGGGAAVKGGRGGSVCDSVAL